MSSDSGRIDVSSGTPRAITETDVAEREGELGRRIGTMVGWLGPNAGAVIGFILIVVAGRVASDVFLSWRNISNVFLQSAMLGVVAVGMTFVILSGGIDLSVGNVVSLGSVVAAMMFANGKGIPLPLVLLATLALGLVVGAINGGIIVWRGVAPFIVTLAMMAIALGTALTITGAKPIGGIQGAYAWIGAGRIDLEAFLLVLIIVIPPVVGTALLRFTRSAVRSAPVAPKRTRSAFSASLSRG